MLGRGRHEGAARKVAICDLGSNSFRLVVFQSDGDSWRRTDEIYEAVRIGAGLAATGRLSEEAMQRALATIEVFHHFCAASGIDEIDAVATSAIRDAENAADLMTRSSLPVRVLSREEEAYYGYLAAINSSTLRDGCVFDLGGGSVQLVSVTDRRCEEIGSWPLGAVRMTEQFGLGSGVAAPKQLTALRKHISEQLAAADWIAQSGTRLVGIGGTVRNLAAAAQRMGKLPEFGVQGFRLERDVLDALVERFAGTPAAERAKVPGIKPARGDLILAGAIVVQTVMEIGGFPSIEVTEAGLREGVFFSKHLDGDPPLFENVRRASVLNLAARYPVDPPGHVEHVAQLALELFDGLAAAGVHEGDAAERELLWAACLLHDIGMAIDYDDHHKHSRYLILSAGLPGFSPREQALVGQTVRYHRKGMPTAGSFAQLLRDGDGRRLLRMATLLRLAEDLERSRDGSVRSAGLVVDDGKVRLGLVAGEDTRVPRWAAGREIDLFRRAYDRELEIH